MDLVLAFMNEHYLRSILLHVGVFFANELAGCLYWLKVFFTWVLGWRCLKNAGVPEGFSLS